MVNPEDQLPLKEESCQQVVDTLLASIYKQKDILNYLVCIEKRKLTQFDKNSTSCLDFKRMSQSVDHILEKIILYETLINIKLKTASMLSHPQTNNPHCGCHCNHSAHCHSNHSPQKRGNHDSQNRDSHNSQNRGSRNSQNRDNHRHFNYNSSYRGNYSYDQYYDKNTYSYWGR